MTEWPSYYLCANPIFDIFRFKSRLSPSEGVALTKKTGKQMLQGIAGRLEPRVSIFGLLANSVNDSQKQYGESVR